MTRIAETQMSAAPAAASNYDQLASTVQPRPVGTKKGPITQKSSPAPFETSSEAKKVNRAAEAVAPRHNVNSAQLHKFARKCSCVKKDTET